MPPPSSPILLNSINSFSYYLHRQDRRIAQRLQSNQTMSANEPPDPSPPDPSPANPDNHDNYYIRNELIPIQIRNIHITDPEVDGMQPYAGPRPSLSGFSGSTGLQSHLSPQLPSEDPIYSRQGFSSLPRTRLSHLRRRPNRVLDPVTLTRQNAIRRKRIRNRFRTDALAHSTRDLRDVFFKQYDQFSKFLKAEYDLNSAECPLFECLANHQHNKYNINEINTWLDKGVLYDEYMVKQADDPDTETNKRKWHQKDGPEKRQKSSHPVQRPKEEDTEPEPDTLDRGARLMSPQLMVPELLDHNSFLRVGSSFDICMSDFHLNWIINDISGVHLRFNLNVLPPSERSSDADYIMALRKFVTYLVPNYKNLGNQHLIEKYQLFDHMMGALHRRIRAPVTPVAPNTPKTAERFPKHIFKFDVNKGRLIDFNKTDFRFLNLKNKFTLLNDKNYRLLRLDRFRLHLQMVKWLNLSPFKLIVSKFVMQMITSSKTSKRDTTQEEYPAKFYRAYTLILFLKKFNLQKDKNLVSDSDAPSKEEKFNKKLQKLLELGGVLESIYKLDFPASTVKEMNTPNVETKLIKLIMNYISCSSGKAPETPTKAQNHFSPCNTNLRMNFTFFQMEIPMLTLINQLFDKVFTMYPGKELTTFADQYKRLNQKFVDYTNDDALYLINSIDKKSGVWSLHNTQILTTPEPKRESFRKLYTQRFNELFNFHRGSSSSDLSDEDEEWDDEWNENSYEEGDDEGDDEEGIDGTELELALDLDLGQLEQSDEEADENPYRMEDETPAGDTDERGIEADVNTSTEESTAGSTAAPSSLFDTNMTLNRSNSTNVTQLLNNVRQFLSQNNPNRMFDYDDNQSISSGDTNANHQLSMVNRLPALTSTLNGPPKPERFLYDDYEECLLAGPTKVNRNKYSAGGGHQTFTVL